MSDTKTIVPGGTQAARRGTRISIGTNGHDALQFLVGIDSPFPVKYQNLLSSIFRLCDVDGHRTTDIFSVSTASNLSPPTIRLYLDRLTKTGLFKKNRLVSHGHRPALLYTMVSVNAFVQSIPNAISDDATARREGEGRALLSAAPDHDLAEDHVVEPLESDGFSILPDTPDRYRAEIFSTYTLLSVLRLGKSGRRSSGSYVTNARIGPATIRIRVTGTDGYRIAGIMDTKSLIGMSTWAREYYSSDGDLDRPLILDIPDFTSFLTFSPSGGNKRHTWDSLRSWEKTGFQVLAAGESIRELFGDVRFLLDEFRFITRLKTLVSGTTPQRVAVYLDRSYLERVMDPRGKFLSAVHAEIMRETSAARLLYYYWCRRAIKYDTTPKFWELWRLRSDMANHMEPAEFSKMIRRVFKLPTTGAIADNEPQVIYGYLSRPVAGLDGSLIGIEVSRDPADRLLASFQQRNLPSKAT